MLDVPSDDLPDKLCDYVFTALTIISLTLENKVFGHGGEQGLRFPLKLSTSQTLEITQSGNNLYFQASAFSNRKVHQSEAAGDLG